jgi:hypothetical protein
VSKPDDSVFWDSGWQSEDPAQAEPPQQPAILPPSPVVTAQPSVALGANAATGGLEAKEKRSNGGPKHPDALGILIAVAVTLIIGNVMLVKAGNAYVPWSEVDATVVGGPIAPEAFLTTATVYLEENNGTAYVEDRYVRSDTQCSTYTDEYGDAYEDCWTEYWDEYECYADLDLRWTVNGTEHQAWEYSPILYDSYPCLSAIEDVFPNGTNLTIAVDPNDPSVPQAFALGLMTEVDEDHPGFRTGYRESSHLEWGGYGRAVLVTTCEMDAAVAYTFDGEAYVRDIWGGSPVTEGWGSSCLVDYVETFGPGSTVTVMVDTENPSEAAWEDPTTDPGLFIVPAMCCSVIIFLAAFVLTGKGGTVRPPIRHHSQFDHHPSGHHRYRGRHRRRHHGHVHRSSRSSGSSHRSSGGGGRGRR